jgi:cob(I)alamin adenosyltransferase
MSIATGLGDDGNTELFAGQFVPKDHPRIEFIGVLDELNAFLGDAKVAARRESTKTLLETIQRDIFIAPLLLAYPDREPGAARGPLPQGGGIDPERLTALIHELEERHPMKGFIVPGTNAGSAKLDIARTACRRAERRLITLSREETVPPALRRYMNRLSDLLFMLAREETDDD